MHSHRWGTWLLPDMGQLGKDVRAADVAGLRAVIINHTRGRGDIGGGS